MLKPGKYLRSKNNGHIYPFDPHDLMHSAMEVVTIDEEGKLIVEASEESPAVDLVVQAEPVSRALERGAVDMSEEPPGQMPEQPPPDEMPDDEPLPEEDSEDELDPARMKRADLVARYVEKYGRKPHPNMRIERLRQAVRGHGNDHG